MKTLIGVILIMLAIDCYATESTSMPTNLQSTPDIQQYCGCLVVDSHNRCID